MHLREWQTQEYVEFLERHDVAYNKLLFLNLLNDSKHVAPNGAFGALMNDGYIPIAPMEPKQLLRLNCPSRPSSLRAVGPMGGG